MAWSVAYELNPLAGSHGVSSDSREIAAARRAGERSFDEFPYYRARFSERGQLFALSDGAWLATLCGREWPQVREQVLWLGRVLAARGIPRLLLERHLSVMHEELTGDGPGHEGRYDALPRAADHVRALREAALPEPAFGEIARAFAQQVGPDWATRLPRMGEILVAAAADQRAGIENAVRSVEVWSTDPGRFPEHWRAAVHATLERARRHV